MTNSYQVGNTSSNISLAASISSLGDKYTEVDNQLPGGGSLEITDSGDDKSGSIDTTSLGKANTLNGCMVDIWTVIDLNDIDSTQWQDVFDNLSASYTFDGGIHGKVVFGCDSNDKNKSKDGSIITIKKHIQLTSN